jgi:hypothetical protein
MSDDLTDWSNLKKSVSGEDLKTLEHSVNSGISSAGSDNLDFLNNIRTINNQPLLPTPITLDECNK